MRHLISLLILFSAIGSYAIGLAKPAETLAFVAMGLELWFWVRVRRAIKTDGRFYRSKEPLC